MNRVELPKSYNHAEYENEIYQKWEQSGFFNPDKSIKKGVIKKDAATYSIVMPPPNVTGSLHIGHALMLVVQDILIRYYRLKGRKALWLPGTDHAAIATQTKVEKILKDQGLDRYKLGREKFLVRVNQYAKESHDTIINQVKKMGSSCDWSREAYTLDEVRTRAVRSVFKMMHDDGLIYRGQRIVNWCPRCQSTLADDEVEYKAQKAKLYTFKYSQDFPFAIATTRPETKLGDTAVAVNPKDNRYKKYIGRFFKINFVGIPLELKIIADRTIDEKFGSGALGVTPAHSQADWQMAEENGLKIIKVIDEQGNIRSGFKEFSGKNAVMARQMIINKLRQQGLLESEQEIENNLSLCYRCDTPIEPLPSLQWFINVNKKIPKYKMSLKELAIAAVKTGVFGRHKIRIVPERFIKNYFHWLNNLRDWCISRQIWFGHQIPVWYKTRTNADNTQTYEDQSGQKLTAWNLKIYGEDIFQAIKNGSKTIETRAGRERGTGKDWSKFKAGEIIKFYLADEETDKVITVVEPVEKIIKTVKHFKTIDQLFKIYSPELDYPGKSLKEIKQWWSTRSALNNRIKKYGIWAFELADMAEKEIYVGVEPPKGDDWKQDEDTLDTWFSSGLWTFSTLAERPEQIKIKDDKLIIDSSDFKYYHPTSVLETGYDILFFWVARMIIMTTYAVADIPFKDIYLHGLVRDEKGRKMSKSLGNTIDPLASCQKYGTDATRLSLIMGTTPGNDINLSEEKIAGFRNFTNKLWNIARYILTNVECRMSDVELNQKKLTAIDEWILGKMQNLIKEVTDDLDNYRFSQAGERLREFTWSDLADWYVEASKFEKNSEKEKILSYVLQNLLKLWHPFLPFITEVIWAEIGFKKMLIIENWPTYTKASEDRYSISNDFELIKKIIIAVRNARSQYRINPEKKIKAVIYASGDKLLVKSQSELIKSLRTGISELDVLIKGEKLKNAIYLTVDGIEIYLIVPGFDFVKEKERLKREINEQEQRINVLEKKLRNKEFIKKAPKEIVRKDKEKLILLIVGRKKLKEQLKSIE